MDIGHQVGRSAALLTDVGTSPQSVFVVGATVNHRPPGIADGDIHPHDCCQCFRTALTAHRTQVHRCIFQHDGLGIFAAAHIAATAAVGTGQRIDDGIHPRVHFHMKGPIGPSQYE